MLSDVGIGNAVFFNFPINCPATDTEQVSRFTLVPPGGPERFEQGGEIGHSKLFYFK